MQTVGSTGVYLGVSESKEIGYNYTPTFHIIIGKRYWTTHRFHFGLVFYI